MDSGSSASNQHCQILLHEEDYGLLCFYYYLLSWKGYSCHPVNSVKRLHEMAPILQPQLVILDFCNSPLNSVEGLKSELASLQKLDSKPATLVQCSRLNSKERSKIEIVGADCLLEKKSSSTFQLLEAVEHELGQGSKPLMNAPFWNPHVASELFSVPLPDNSESAEIIKSFVGSIDSSSGANQVNQAQSSTRRMRKIRARKRSMFARSETAPLDSAKQQKKLDQQDGERSDEAQRLPGNSILQDLIPMPVLSEEQRNANSNLLKKWEQERLEQCKAELSRISLERKRDEDNQLWHAESEQLLEYWNSVCADSMMLSSGADLQAQEHDSRLTLLVEHERLQVEDAYTAYDDEARLWAEYFNASLAEQNGLEQLLRESEREYCYQQLKASTPTASPKIVQKTLSKKKGLLEHGQRINDLKRCIRSRHPVPISPNTLQELRNLAKTECFDSALLAEVASQDMALVQEVLRIARSPLYSSNSNKYEKLEVAIERLGADAFLPLLHLWQRLSLAHCPSVEAERLQQHVSLRSIFIRELASAVNIEADKAWSFSQAVDMGRYLLLQKYPAELANIKAETTSSMLERQQEIFGEDECSISSSLWRTQGFDSQWADVMRQLKVQDEIGDHSLPKNMASGSLDLIELFNSANAYAKLVAALDDASEDQSAILEFSKLADCFKSRDMVSKTFSTFRPKDNSGDEEKAVITLFLSKDSPLCWAEILLAKLGVRTQVQELGQITGSHASLAHSLIVVTAQQEVEECMARIDPAQPIHWIASPGLQKPESILGDSWMTSLPQAKAFIEAAIQSDQELAS